MEQKKGAFWKFAKRVGGYFLIAFAAMILYGTLFVFLLGTVGGETRFGAALQFLKSVFTLDILNYKVETTVLPLFVGLPSLFIAWLSGKFSNKLNFTLLPLISLAVSLFAAPLAHIAIFRFPLNADLERHMNVSIVTAAIFMLVFTFAAAARKKRQRSRADAARAALGWESSALESAGPWGARWKFAGGYLAIILIAGAALIGFGAYEINRRERAVGDLAKRLEEARQADYERAMADTYGGKTPQETLRLYIEAVEAGDYELASKYLTEDKSSGETRELEALNAKGNLDIFLDIVKNAEPDSDIIGDTFRMKSLQTINGVGYFIGFVRYPNGIWKITEI